MAHRQAVEKPANDSLHLLAIDEVAGRYNASGRRLLVVISGWHLEGDIDIGRQRAIVVACLTGKMSVRR